MKKNRHLRQKTSMDFDLRHLEIFCKVVELKSFSKAAEAVFLAQASVSERIATLEGMVGTKLLDRMRRQILPTRAGKILYRHAVRLLEMKKAACLEMEDFLGVKKGEIHIGASTIPGEYIFPEVIRSFNEQYPLISVTLTIADTNEIENMVLQGDFELGVVGSKSLNKELVFKDLWNDELVLAVPENHRWAEKDEIDIKEVLKEPFILREAGSGTLKVFEKYLNISPLKLVDSLNVAARFGSSTAVKEAVKAGLGVSILSVRAIDTEINAGMLKTLKLKGLTMKRKFYLISDKMRTVSPICRAMINFLSVVSHGRDL